MGQLVRPRYWMSLVVLTVVVTGCTGAPSDDSAGGGAVRVAIAELPPAQADPAQHLGRPAVLIWPAFYDGLTFIDSAGDPEPWLATGWELTEPTVWTFQLKEGVEFSNGEPFDAASIVKAADEILFGYGAEAPVRLNLLPTVTDVRAVSDQVVEIETEDPDPLLPKRVAQLYPLPPEYFDEVGSEGFAAAPIGTGPYVVDDWSPGRVTMSANPSSWRPGQVDTLEFIEIPESSSRRAAITSGQVEIAYDISPTDVEDVEAGGVEVHIGTDPRIRTIAFFQRREGSPVASADVRLALNHAVNMQQIIDTFYAGRAPIASQAATSNATGYNDQLSPYAYDPELAQDLLADAGYPDGFPMSVEVVASTDLDKSLYEAVAQDLRAVGVEVELREIPFAEWREKLYSAGWESDAFSFSIAFDPTFDVSRGYQNLGCDVEHAFFCDETVTDMVRQADSMVDADARAALLRDAQEVAYDNPPAIFMEERVELIGVQGVAGFETVNLIAPWHSIAVAG
ncbi:MAG: hypothetical protein GEV12_21995 [Micromonosporaceae bacterium]|nr:hypothetical protein [Micromonosporaceae bacterium]